MVLSHHFLIRQKIHSAACTVFHAVIGCGIQTIPLAIYLHIIPHMKIIAAIRRPVIPLYQHTSDTHSIQNHLDCPGIALAKTLSFNECAIGGAYIFIAACSRCVCRALYDCIVNINNLILDRLGLLSRFLHDRIDPVLMFFDRTLHVTLAGKTLCKISVRPSDSKRRSIHRRIIVRHTGIPSLFLRQTYGQIRKIHIENIGIVRIKSIPRRTEHFQDGLLVSAVGRQLLTGNMAARHKIILLVSGLEDIRLIHLIHGIIDTLCISIQLIIVIPLITLVLRPYAAASSRQAKRKRQQNGHHNSQKSLSSHNFYLFCFSDSAVLPHQRITLFWVKF